MEEEEDELRRKTVFNPGDAEYILEEDECECGEERYLDFFVSSKNSTDTMKGNLPNDWDEAIKRARELAIKHSGKTGAIRCKHCGSSLFSGEIHKLPKVKAKWTGREWKILEVKGEPDMSEFYPLRCAKCRRKF